MNFIMWIKTVAVHAPTETTDKQAGEYIERLDTIWQAAMTRFTAEAHIIAPGLEIKGD